MREFLVGQFNRWKNYARWSWDWYLLHPYRNTLVGVLLLLVFMRGGKRETIEAAPATKEPAAENTANFKELPCIEFKYGKTFGHAVLMPAKYADLTDSEKLCIMLAAQKAAKQQGLFGRLHAFWQDKNKRTHLELDLPVRTVDVAYDQSGEKWPELLQKKPVILKLEDFPVQQDVELFLLRDADPNQTRETTNG